MTFEENLKAIERVIDYVKGCGLFAEQGIKAIREMQAELAGREADGSTRVLREDLETAQALIRRFQAYDTKQRKQISEAYTQRDNTQISADILKSERDAARATVDGLKEELRIAKTSWNFKEGKRIIAERDAALAEVERLKGRGSVRYCGRTAGEWYKEVVRLRGLITKSQTFLRQARRDD